MGRDNDHDGLSAPSLTRSEKMCLVGAIHVSIGIEAASSQHRSDCHIRSGHFVLYTGANWADNQTQGSASEQKLGCAREAPPEVLS